MRDGAEWDRRCRIGGGDPLHCNAGFERGDTLSRQAALADAGSTGDDYPAAVVISQRQTDELQLFGTPEQRP